MRHAVRRALPCAMPCAMPCVAVRNAVRHAVRCRAPCRALPCSLRSPNAQAASAEVAARQTQGAGASRRPRSPSSETRSCCAAPPRRSRRSPRRSHCERVHSETIMRAVQRRLLLPVTAADRSMQCGEDFVESAARISIASSIGSCSTSSYGNIATIALHCAAMRMSCIALHRCSSALSHDRRAERAGR
jgi:hypothetical protein